MSKNSTLRTLEYNTVRMLDMSEIPTPAAAEAALEAAIGSAVSEPVNTPSEHTGALAGLLEAYDASLRVQQRQIDRRREEIMQDYRAASDALMTARDRRLALLDDERRDVERASSMVGHALGAGAK